MRLTHLLTTVVVVVGEKAEDTITVHHGWTPNHAVLLIHNRGFASDMLYPPLPLRKRKKGARP